MDLKRLATTVLVVVVLTFALQYVFHGFGGPAPAGPAPSPLYQNLPKDPTASENGAASGDITLGNATERSDPDKLAIDINPQTAAIDLAQLNIRDYPATIAKKKPLTLFSVLDSEHPMPTGVRPFATIGVHILVNGADKEQGYGIVHSQTAGAAPRELTSNDSAETISLANSTAILDRQYLWKATAGPKDDKGVRHDVSLVMTLLGPAGSPLAQITKTFHEDPASYEVTITHTIKNLSDQPITVAIDQLGAPNFFRDDPRSDDRFFHAAALNTAQREVDSGAGYKTLAFNLTQLELANTKDVRYKDGGWEVAPSGQQNGQFDDYKDNPFLWVASSNRFFGSIIRPLPESGSTAAFSLATSHTIPEAHHVQSAYVDLLTVAPKPTESQAMLRITGHMLAVPAHGEISEPLSVYLGPKDRDSLKGNLGALDNLKGPPTAEQQRKYDYAVYDYSDIIQYSRGCWVYSFCVFDWLIGAFLWALEFLHNTVAFGNYGVAIIILVVIIRAILHPLTRASQINMAKMSKKMKDVQPKVEAMKKKYADNKRKQSEEMMRIYRENNVNPAGGVMGCLPMLLQTPIWIAAWSGVAADINLRQQPFIPGWINDLSNPDTIFPHGPIHINAPLFTLPVLNFPIFGFNPLPILLAVVLFLNTKVTMALQKPADEQQAQMQKISSYMTLLFPLFMYNASSGLTLYYFASMMAGLVDTYLVRKSLKKQGVLPSSAQTLPTHEET